MKENKNKVLKLSTSGSVDDGKSTLIGRLLYDTHSLPVDKLEAIRKSSEQRGYDYLDFSFATDGLIAEREQGITIDVAHIYFSTPSKSYIIADTPGHVEYTRNMVTGSSTSQVSVILIDARNGVIEQTRRHFFIANLLRIREVVVAINKMDLVAFGEERFQKIVRDFKEMAASAQFEEQHITYIPMSALHGDNVVNPSSNMPWYREKTLLSYLEELQIEDIEKHAFARFQVQTVIRPKKEEFRDFRGYAGKLKGATLSVGDEIVVLPSRRTSKVKTIEYFDQQYLSASKGSSFTLTLEDDLDVSRGDMMVKSGEMPEESKLINATVCWMDNQPLRPASMFYLQYGVRVMKSKITNILGKIRLDRPEVTESVGELKMNDLGQIEVKLAKPLQFDFYANNRETGSFILIDPKSNTTAGVGFIG